MGEVVLLNKSAVIVTETVDPNQNHLEIQTVPDENTKKDLEAGQEVGVVHLEGKRGRRKVVTGIVEMATIVIELGNAIGTVIGNATNTVVHLPNLIQRVAYCRS